MSASRWFLLVSFVVFMVASLRLIFQLLSATRSKPLSAPKGKPTVAVFYSLTGAMLPWKKESAYHHWSVYTLGVAYHIGVFLGFAWLIVLVADFRLPPVMMSASGVLLALASVCGFALLIRRIASPKLRYFSSADDYFSNILVTGFQALTAVSLISGGVMPGLLVYAGMLLLYIPLGKLRHALYFVSARVYLGRFYGWRGVWPARNDSV
jgi:hypothetical protein